MRYGNRLDHIQILMQQMTGLAKQLEQTLKPLIREAWDGEMDDEELDWWIDNLPRDGMFDNIIRVFRSIRRERKMKLERFLEEQEDIASGDIIQ